jgi:hypothetical protein
MLVFVFLVCPLMLLCARQFLDRKRFINEEVFVPCFASALIAYRGFWFKGR